MIRGLHENELGKLKLIHVVEDCKKRVLDACSHKQVKNIQLLMTDYR